MNEGGDGVECVKKEMRIELHLQRGEAGLGETSLRREGAALPLTRQPRPDECLASAEDYAVEQDIECGTHCGRRTVRRAAASHSTRAVSTHSGGLGPRGRLSTGLRREKLSEQLVGKNYGHTHREVHG